MIGPAIVQAVIYGGVVSWLCWWIHLRIVVRRQVREQRGYSRGPIPARHHTDGRSDDKVAYDEWAAAWLKPNEEFILKTDKVINDIEWARLTDAEQRVRTAREKAEHEQMHRDNPGAIYGGRIRIGVASIGPGEDKPTYSFEKHDQGEAVIA